MIRGCRAKPYTHFYVLLVRHFFSKSGGMQTNPPMRSSRTSSRKVLADYKIIPKGNSPTGHGPLEAPTNKVREPLRWFDPALLFVTKNCPENNRGKTSRQLDEPPVSGNKF